MVKLCRVCNANICKSCPISYGYEDPKECENCDSEFCMVCIETYNIKILKPERTTSPVWEK